MLEDASAGRGAEVRDTGPRAAGGVQTGSAAPANASPPHEMPNTCSPARTARGCARSGPRPGGQGGWGAGPAPCLAARSGRTLPRARRAQTRSRVTHAQQMRASVHGRVLKSKAHSTLRCWRSRLHDQGTGAEANHGGAVPGGSAAGLGGGDGDSRTDPCRAAAFHDLGAVTNPVSRPVASPKRRMND